MSICFRDAGFSGWWHVLHGCPLRRMAGSGTSPFLTSLKTCCQKWLVFVSNKRIRPLNLKVDRFFEMTFYQQLTDSQRFLSKNPLKTSEYPSKNVSFDLSAPGWVGGSCWWFAFLGPRFCRVLDSADRKGGVEGVALMVTFNQNMEEIWKQMDFFVPIILSSFSMNIHLVWGVRDQRQWLVFL